jgi:hypothetical protein
MAKESGLAWTTLSVDDSGGTPQVIKNDITSLELSTPREVQEVTGIDKSAVERLLLLADLSISLDGVYNDAAGASHAVFKTVPSTSVNRTVALTVSGQSLTPSPECLFTDYSLSRGEKGELTWKAPGVLADGAVPTWS